MSVMDKFSLKDRVAIVTGGNRSIGRAIAVGLAEAGATVVIAARDQGKSAEAVNEIQGLGGKAVALPVDVSQRDSIQRLHDTVEKEVGPTDVLVNNAGIGFHADALT